MISHFDIRLALRGPFLTAALAQFVGKVDYEGETFNPANLGLWMQEKLLPATDQASSDTTEGSAGIYQLSIYAPASSGIGIDPHITTIEKESAIVANIYNPNTVSISITGGSIVIDSTDALPVVIDKQWQFIPISILYRAFKLN